MSRATSPIRPETPDRDAPRASALPRLVVAGLFVAASAVLAPNWNRTDVASADATTRPTTAPAAAEKPAAGPLTIGDRTFVQVNGKPGFWRTGRTSDNVWWFISPDDKLEFLNTVTTVQPFQLGRRKAGPHYVSRDWNGEYDVNSGDLKAWAGTTLARVRDAGFKGLGAWCNPVFHGLDVSITRDLNLWAHADYADRLLYSPNWTPTIEEAVRRQVTPLANNRNLVGYYTDNELDWSDSGAGPAAYFNNLPATDPNKRKVVEVIRRLWPEIAEFNVAFRTKLESWDALYELPTLSHEPAEAYGKLLDAWTEQLASDYHRITSELVRKYDPNHLVLGVRFKGSTTASIIRGSVGHTDAVSLNYYPADAKIDPDLFPMIARESKQPLIITEYSFHSLDGRSGNRNTFGFNAQVLDQQARADGYKLMTQRLARTPYIIGADWFQWMDEPPSGRTTDGEDVNFGIVDVDDSPYDKLVDSVRATTPTLNGLHATSASDLGLDIARERFSERVRADVPYLATKINLNGELSDWPKETKLQGMRHSQTLGNDRSPLPLPNVHLAWTEAGLYFAAEVFDKDIDGAPATGWWWTRDAVELFVSSKRAEGEQGFYTPHDHQFFFVPIAYPGADGEAGTVGRWHRNGDGLADHIIPHPLIRQAARVFPDRYVVEMFVPKEAIEGWDPTGKTLMGLNVQVRNFQNAIDYFWSAPRQVQTQLRPGTWGEMVLMPRITANMAKTE